MVYSIFDMAKATSGTSTTKTPGTKGRTAAGESTAAPRRPRPSQGAEAFSRYERARTAIMVGSAVRAARRRSGVSQAELARRAKTSQPSIARLEKGQVSPTVISLDRIARALGTELIIDFEPVAEGPEPSVRAK
jgi:ribosome-binding protein aMBF1 (putative translation factor)